MSEQFYRLYEYSTFSVNCSWVGSGSGNLTWMVDGDAPDNENVEEAEGGSSALINLVWEKMGKNAGDRIRITCSGQSAGRTNETGAWASISEMMETIIVPGVSVESSRDAESEESDETSEETDDDTSEESEESDESDEFGESDQEEEP